MTSKSGLNEETEKYFQELGKEIERTYRVAEKARSKGLDPVDRVESPLALTMAAKVVRLIATVYPQLDNEDIINRVLELEEKYGALEASVSFKIAEEIAKEKYCKFETQLEAMDAGIRVGFAYITLGVVSSPIEGYTGIKTGKTQVGETYLKAYFSGPIRSAGTTASCVAIMLIDYIRQLFGYAKYDPTEEECKRVVTELNDYHDRVTNLQYLPTEEEIYFLAKNCPIQIAGEPTEKREVSNYKNLARVESDFIRGGLCLILGEGLAQKAQKGLRLLKKVQENGFKVDDWEWLDEYVELHEKREKGKTDDSPTYIKDLVAGRPVLGHPGKGFRFRYGRSRAAGFSAASIHPATMAMTGGLIAIGTQLRIEKPTKGCIVTMCDSIDGPIVKFKNGSVKKIDNWEEAKEVYDEVEEIIYLGDILFPLGDVINRNSMLVKPSYVEEWWGLELEKAIKNSKNIGNTKQSTSKNIGNTKQDKQGDVREVDEFSDIDYFKVELNEAVRLSEKFGIPLHPKYIYYWRELSYEQFLSFVDWFERARINEGKLLFPYNSSEKERFKVGKRALELLGVEHSVSVENVVLEEEGWKSLLTNLGFEKDYEGELNIDYKFKKYEEMFNDGICDLKKEGEKVLEIVNELSKFVIKDKVGEFIGSRMGRPEKAKLRKLTGSPSVLFPVGDEGGRFRSVNEAVRVGSVKGDFPFNYCTKCEHESIYRVCEVCGRKNEKRYYCRMCDREIKEEKCDVHDMGNNFKSGKIDINYYYEKAREKLGMIRHEVPELIKGVRGTSSGGHNLENLSKGLLRAKYGLCVNKDGTVRYDMTEMPLSHFKPKEIEVSVERLKELGYVKDYVGKELVDDAQILELKPHDILVPCNVLSGDERGDDVFVSVSKFMDELLEKVYGLDKFYNVEKRGDLVGQLGVCMSPHNCAGVVCRIIGFTKVQGLMASPYLHAAMRRDCVHPNTGFVYFNGDGINNEKIGDYVERLIDKGNEVKRIDSFGTERVELGENERNIYAFGINPQTKKLTKKKIKYFIKSTEPEKWIKLKTESGRVQIMTPTHDFFYLDENNNFKIKKASEIKKGDRIAVLKNYKKFIGREIYNREFKKRRIKNGRGFDEEGDFFIDVIKNVGYIYDKKPSYCFDVENEGRLDKNVLWGEGIINFRCDGDEAAMMLLLDVLVNFSRKFLPSHRGGTQDAPLVLNGRILAREVDDQILDFELVNNYPLELYEKAEKKLHSSEIEIEMVKQRIGRGEDPYVNTGFTHDSSDFNLGVTCSAYKTLPTMREKVEAQMKLCEKLRSVNQGDVARLIIDRHFMRDLKGNLRKFSQQTFRCSKCNTIYRRPPLNGRCKCNGNIIFTISYGSIVKYLEPAIDLTKNYDVPDYIKQDLELTKRYIESIFGKDNEKQELIERWF